jgi:hypothetical protein
MSGACRSQGKDEKFIQNFDSETSSIGVDERTILKRILGKWNMKRWTGINWFRTELHDWNQRVQNRAP